MKGQRKVIFLFCFLILISAVPLQAQEKNYEILFGSATGYVHSSMPFWLRANRNGDVSDDLFSVKLFSSFKKDYQGKNKRFSDWAFSFEPVIYAGKSLKFILPEAYISKRLSFFEIKAGRSKEITGLCDSSLSSGSYSFSGNAPGIPLIQLGIPEFVPLPFLGKIIAVKSKYYHGWIGKAPMKSSNGTVLWIPTYIHHKSIYFRFGKPGWRFKLYSGLNHQALWGNEREYYGSDYSYSVAQTYLKVIRAASYLPNTRLGDHLGSLDLGMEYSLGDVTLFAYRQNIYEAGALYYLANLKDGLNGLSIINTGPGNETFTWKKILFELFYTKSQGGEPWSVPRPSGAEDYYNNWQYINGWTYKGFGIGNPFISSRTWVVKDFPSYRNDYYINNRVVVFHLGYQGSVKEFNMLTRISYSLNYGTYNTIDLPIEYKQLSAYLAVNRTVGNLFNLGLKTAFDSGSLYYDSYGILLNVTKTFH